MSVLSFPGRDTRRAAALALALASTSFPCVAVALPAAPEPREQALSRRAIDDLITEAARRFGLPPRWIRAVMKQESGFNPRATSHAGAMGLMQVMPATAEHIAPKLGLDFDAAKLTSDPAYNAAMGSGYLRQLVDEFGPSIALVASGYNAGPGRPRRWITEFGDPRRPDVDVVDWVETIPFSETRTYVMRVSESVVIYRAKLRGAAGPVRLTAELKG